MEEISSKQTYSTSHVECLPFIHSQLSALMTLNTELTCAVKLSDEINQDSVNATFDIPLYLNSRAIVQLSEDPNFKNYLHSAIL